MAPHSSTLAWKIPWMEEPGGPQSVGSLRVGHDWLTSLSLFTFMHWRRKWQPTPVFLPGESKGRGSLMGCRLWGHTESDTTEATWQLSRPFRCQSSWTGQWMKQCRLSAFPREGSTQWRACPGVTRLTFRAGASAAIWSPVLPPCHTCSADSKLTRWTVDLTDVFPFSPFLKVLSPYRFSFKIYVICFRHLFIFHVLAKIIFLWRLKTHDILTI